MHLHVLVFKGEIIYSLCNAVAVYNLTFQLLTSFVYFSMSESDELLVHLHSFSANTVNYKVADSLKQGVPLFYLPPNQTSPQVNIQLSTK